MPEGSTAPAPTKRSRIRFPPQLPISGRVGDIIELLDSHQVVIVSGATGSGKTTQLPKVALEMGRGGRRRIGVTQPRRIAAISVATRVAQELDCRLGDEVGYKIRFEDRTSPATWVKFMTDGVLLAEIQSDRHLDGYDTLIVDEAHERSLNIDFVLGWLKRILPSRPDLKIIISSATIETERFSDFFDGAPVVEVAGRTFPVDVLYEPADPDLDLPDAVAQAVENVTSLDPQGDILVFLPGEREIRETERALAGRALRHTAVLPLFSRLAKQDQARVFSTLSQRRVILATNVAETSLTIPGIVYVIDTGVARTSRYDPRTGTTRLLVEAISQASADQRKGRCGRVRDGICVRLYDETGFLSRPAFTDPEILRTGLAGVILRMKALDLGDIATFPFLDAPHPRAVTEGFRILEELGALTEAGDLTPLGRQLSRFPVDPRVARMLLASVEFNCRSEILVLAAALNIQDPRERPRDKEQQADAAHRRFRDEQSDFVGLLRLWQFITEAQTRGLSSLRKVCKENYLSFSRIREWLDLHRQLDELLRELRLDEPPAGRPRSTPSGAPPGDAVHMALLSGLLSRIGQWNAESKNYLGAKQTRFCLHPSSGLAKKPPAWVMTYELVQTTQLFARWNAKIEPAWLDRVGSHLFKRSYSDPHWSEKSARAQVKERATLFGLTVFRDRSVDYASISPSQARQLFITHALVRGEYRTNGAFHEHNRGVFDEVARLRDRARKSELLVDDDGLLAFFDQRIPDSVVNGKTFEAWRTQVEREAPELLHLSYDDVQGGDQVLRVEDYPDALDLCGCQVPITYTFDPSASDDGATLHLPLPLLSQLNPGQLDWTVPGWHREKLIAILGGLPRPIRLGLGKIPELVDSLSLGVEPFSTPLLPALARAVQALTSFEIPVEAFRPDAVPDFLRFNCRIVGEQGKVLAESRDIASLLAAYGDSSHAVHRADTQRLPFQQDGLTHWTCGELPDYVCRDLCGTTVRSYPALVDQGDSVAVTLLASHEQSQAAHRAGVRRLLLLALRPQLAALAKRAPPPLQSNPGLPVPRAEVAAYRERFLSMVVDLAFELDGSTPLPRSSAAFELLLSRGTPRLESLFASVTRTALLISEEYAKTLGALANAARHPSGQSASADVRTQLERLVGGDFFAEAGLAQLEHFPRYLRATQIRLARAVVDPRKDANKSATFAHLWRAFLTKETAARDRGTTRSLHWAFEELRVAIFAPELKTAQAVTVSAIEQAVTRLR